MIGHGWLHLPLAPGLPARLSRSLRGGFRRRLMRRQRHVVLRRRHRLLRHYRFSPDWFAIVGYEVGGAFSVGCDLDAIFLALLAATTATTASAPATTAYAAITVFARCAFS